jgi:hypothetical protein
MTSETATKLLQEQKNAKEAEDLKSALLIAREALQVSKADHENRGDYYDGYCTIALRRIDELIQPCPP